MALLVEPLVDDNETSAVLSSYSSGTILGDRT